MEAHWREFGRNYYARHDYEGLDALAAHALIAALGARLDALPGTKVGPLTVAAADDFSYHDPVDGSISSRQGIRVMFEGGSRVVGNCISEGCSGSGGVSLSGCAGDSSGEGSGAGPLPGATSGTLRSTRSRVLPRENGICVGSIPRCVSPI